MPASIITGCDVCDIGTTAGSAGYAMDATNATDVTGGGLTHDRKKHYKPQLGQKFHSFRMFAFSADHQIVDLESNLSTCSLKSLV